MECKQFKSFLYLCCTILLLGQLVTVTSSKSASSLWKTGRKERCRHVVKKEAQKYSRRVQALTTRVLSLQHDILIMTKKQQNQQAEMTAIKNNFTAQHKLLSNAIVDIKELQRQMIKAKTIQEGYLKIPQDCDEIYRNGGLRFKGTYEMTIQPTTNSSQFQVLCEPINNAGWIVMQTRLDGSVNFQRNWKEYKDGFGKFNSEFWLGNEKIHEITSGGPTTLRVELEEFSGQRHWAEYSQFSIADEVGNYAINISGYRGTAGDAMLNLNGQQFSTFDQDHDSKSTDNCAHQYSAGWWYKTCSTSNLNAEYLDETTHKSFLYKHGIVWPTVHPYKTLKHSRLLLKPTAHQ